MRARAAPSARVVDGDGAASGVRRHGRAGRRRAAVRAALEAVEGDDFVHWLSCACKDDGIASRVRVNGACAVTKARGIEALRPLAPGEVIFSIPYSLVMETRLALDASEADGRGEAWSSAMAMDILELKRDFDGAGASRRRWLEELPCPAPSTPAMDFNEEELAMIEDERVRAEAIRVRTAHERDVVTYADRLAHIGASADDFREARNVVHSRVFARRDGDCVSKLLVPGVDMVNHSATLANAVVRVVTSPENCQGRAATEEIADVSSSSSAACDVVTEDKYFQLVVDPDGETIDCGDEVLISYGAFPNDPFLMYFGFVPDDNPNDTVILFDDVDELFEFIERDETLAAKALCMDDDAKSQARAVSPSALSCTIDAVDGALIQICDGIIQIPWLDVVRARCRNILTGGRFSTKIAEDVALARSNTLSPNAALALAFRLHKKAILIAPLGQSLAQYEPTA